MKANGSAEGREDRIKGGKTKDGVGRGGRRGGGGFGRLGGQNDGDVVGLESGSKGLGGGGDLEVKVVVVVTIQLIDVSVLVDGKVSQGIDDLVDI